MSYIWGTKQEPGLWHTELPSPYGFLLSIPTFVL